MLPKFDSLSGIIIILGLIWQVTQLLASDEYYSTYHQLRSDTSTPAIKCGAQMEVSLHQAVFIETPNYGERKKYPNSINCKWNFRV
ncbi:unnamed protein product, partial [Allacma fusca]